MTRRIAVLLGAAEVLCGAQTRDTVFEPLVADWQREWLAADTAAARARVMLRGGAAYALSLGLRLDTRDVVQRHAIVIGWSALPLFSAIGGWILYLYTLPWILLTWSSRSDRLESYPFEYLTWHVPAVMTYGLLFAALPVCATLAAGATRARVVVAALVMTGGLYVAIDGWWTPRARAGNLRQYHGERAVAGNFRVFTSDALVVQALDADTRIASAARTALRPRVTMPLSLIGLGVIGAAIGWRLRRAHRAIGVGTILAAWLGGWLTASVLGRSAGYQGMYREPAAPDVTMWLPALALLAIGIAAWLVLYRQNRENLALPRTK